MAETHRHPVTHTPDRAPPGAEPGGWFRRFHTEATAWLVLAGALLITLLSWWLSNSYVEQRAQDRFDYEVQQAEAAILRRMQEYEQVLRSGVGLFSSSDDVTRQDWHRFVSHLELHTYWPGLQGLGYAVMLTPEQRPAFVERVRQEGFTDFEIKPPGQRALYSSIVYLEPFSDRNLRAFGFDMYSEPTRRQAMEQARDSGRPAVSGPVTLVQENGQDVQTGFLMYMPHYHPDLPLDTLEQRRAALIGFVYSPFRTSDLMQGILGEDERLFNFRILDGQAPLNSALLHATEAVGNGSGARHRFATTRQLQLPGRTWKVEFFSSPALERELKNTQPLIVGMGGLVVDLLLFITILSLSLSRQRTAAWAKEQNRLLEQLQLSASVFQHAREGILITDAQGKILDVNPMFETLTGYPRQEAIGRNPSLLKSGRQDQDFYQQMWRQLLDNGHWEGEVWNRRKSGEVYAEALNISAVRGVEGSIRHFIGLFSDITALKHHQSQLEHMAHFDALTGLPNRVLLGDRLQQAMAQTQRRGMKLAVVYLDLDGFKGVNDDLGHDAGDRFLIQTAERMKTTLREGDTLARLGGDEFVAVLLDLPDIEACVPLVLRLLAAASQDVPSLGSTRRVSASLGVTFYPQNETVDADQLLRQADQAMYQAKLAGKNRYHIFDMDQDRAVRGHHESLERIRQALEQNELLLYYQPKVNMRTGQVVGAEALIRWQHPQRGLLAPSVFLPVIEGHPLTLAVGDWVLNTALAQWQQWRQAGLHLQLSVNINAMQIQQPDFVQNLQQHLTRLGNVPAQALELEVLETSALEDIHQVSRVIEQCQGLGVSFALDDFGTGYSSLTYLKRLQAQTLKVDRSFVRDMLDDLDDLAILEGVLGLARAFDRVAVAEGVESVAHGELLLDLGCELAQGYGIARPMPAADLPHWLNEWQPPASWLHRAEREPRTLPLLFAMVEHRNWVQAVEDHVRLQGHAPPMDCVDCKFGHWLEHDGRSQFGQRPVYAELQALHQTIHDHARRLLALKAEGQTDQALAGLEELQRLRDTLLQHLQVLTC